MRPRWPLLMLLLAVGFSAAAGDVPPHLAASVASPARPEADRARDADRRPAEVLAFLGIEPGMQIADLQAGAGYYSEILAVAVGERGRVYLQNNRFVRERFGDMGISERLEKPGMANVVRWPRELDDLELPVGGLDAVLLVLFYHDTFWMDVDRAKMNAEVWKALKPGGVFGVIDHHAEAGSGERDVKTLHRGDADQIRQEIVAAGFVFEAESDLLRHPEDDHTKSVFDETIRGRTDRFVYRFRKPES